MTDLKALNINNVDVLYGTLVANFDRMSYSKKGKTVLVILS